MIRLTRRYHFPAAHVLAHPSLSQAENERVYGKCANPAGHGHNYEVEVALEGPIDERTGRIADPDVLDRIFDETVRERFGHRMLNEDPLFRERVPTAENLAEVIRFELDAPIARGTGARLAGVRVLETRKNFFVSGDIE